MAPEIEAEVVEIGGGLYAVTTFAGGVGVEGSLGDRIARLREELAALEAQDAARRKRLVYTADEVRILS